MLMRDLKIVTEWFTQSGKNNLIYREYKYEVCPTGKYKGEVLINSVKWFANGKEVSKKLFDKYENQYQKGLIKEY